MSVSSFATPTISATVSYPDHVILTLSNPFHGISFASILIGATCSGDGAVRHVVWLVSQGQDQETGSDLPRIIMPQPLSADASLDIVLQRSLLPKPDCSKFTVLAANTSKDWKTWQFLR